MKTIYKNSVVIFLLFYATNSLAQIPNSGFENWASVGNYHQPTGWWCSNDSIDEMNSYFPVTMSSDHFPPNAGSYSIRLENQPLLPSWQSGGIAWTGDWFGNDHPAFPVSGHPLILYGYYKYFPQNNDTMDIHIRLYKHGVDVAGGVFYNGTPAEEWTSFSIPISSYEDADSARIMIAAWHVETVGLIPLGNSVLFADNLSFDNLITSARPLILPVSGLYVYPNPANHQIQIELVVEQGIQSQLEIFNIFGQQLYIGSVSNESGITLNVSDYPMGVYCLRLTTGNKLTDETKFVIMR